MPLPEPVGRFQLPDRPGGVTAPPKTLDHWWGVPVPRRRRQGPESVRSSRNAPPNLSTTGSTPVLGYRHRMGIRARAPTSSTDLVLFDRVVRVEWRLAGEPGRDGRMVILVEQRDGLLALSDRRIARSRLGSRGGGYRRPRRRPHRMPEPYGADRRGGGCGPIRFSDRKLQRGSRGRDQSPTWSGLLTANRID